jgi:DNA mismatch repair protein MutS
VWEFELDNAVRSLNQYFNTRDLAAAFDCQDMHAALQAAGCLLQYARETQKSELPHIQGIQVEQLKDSVILDAASRRNLELDTNLSGGRDNTLLQVMDGTATAMGSRLLSRWLNHPLRDHVKLQSRQQVVAALIEDYRFENLSGQLRAIGDLERILARLAALSTAAGPGKTAGQSGAIACSANTAARHRGGGGTANRHRDRRISSADYAAAGRYRREPPVVIREGGVIAPSYDAELDELRNLSSNAGQYLVDLELRERERTGLSTLKVGYNRVHGYYIEVSKGQAVNELPAEYVRRQTLKNTERFITPELKEFEDKVLSSRSKVLAREKDLYEKLLDTVAEELTTLLASAAAIAKLDVLNNFAERAVNLNYYQPRLVEEPGIVIENGRHPVVERVTEEAFVANDLYLNELQKMLIITGPNMGGKSTYMRQTALIVLLALCGSWVPASAASIGPIDRIFTRIGSSDDLAGGRSTFMVEMTETANILHSATPPHQPGVDGRNRPWHQHLRWPIPGLGGGGLYRRETAGLYPVCHSLLRAHHATGKLRQHRELRPAGRATGRHTCVGYRPGTWQTGSAGSRIYRRESSTTRVETRRAGAHTTRPGRLVRQCAPSCSGLFGAAQSRQNHRQGSPGNPL